MHNYSVVIPYKDTLELLNKAVGSIPDREDIQVIIIDNSTIPIAQKDIPRKQRATVLYLTSDSQKGAGHARNVGLQHVDGKHILFLDADDYFTDGAFSVFDEFIDTDYDIVYFKADSIKLSNGLQSNRHVMINERVDVFLNTGNEDLLRYKFPNPICKLYRATFVLSGSFLFDEVKVSNDMMFSLRTGHAAKKINAYDNVVYIITEGDKNSSLIKTRSAENQFIRFKVAVDNYIFVESIGRPDLRYELFSYVVHSLVDFGPKECIKYLRYAKKQRVNIFYGFSFRKLFK